jgi:hypothetical protein
VHTQAGLPFAESESSQATHASCCAAVEAEGFCDSQLGRYVEYLRSCDERGADDYEAHRDTGISRAALCLRRHDLGLVGALESREQRRHKRQGAHWSIAASTWRTFAVWRLTPDARALPTVRLVERVAAVRLELARVKRAQGVGAA